MKRRAEKASEDQIRTENIRGGEYNLKSHTSRTDNRREYHRRADTSKSSETMPREAKIG